MKEEEKELKIFRIDWPPTASSDSGSDLGEGGGGEGGFFGSQYLVLIFGMSLGF